MSENQNDMLEVVDNQSGNKDPGRMAKAAGCSSFFMRFPCALLVCIRLCSTRNRVETKVIKKVGIAYFFNCRNVI